jgi:hypothetical protein
MNLKEVNKKFPIGTKVIFKDNHKDTDYRDNRNFGNGIGIVRGNNGNGYTTCLFIDFENGSGKNNSRDGVYADRFDVIDTAVMDPLEYVDKIIAELERG